ncbi:adenylate/guanylate cyclase domain-containing protein [Arvimicrobium flavum]|uniref:adenylate/guanylate cyclase domain-containing protein n=1 Tax=Arvimicrobium flavum TaxID=3393320 RepID=UPI00237BE087|nr:adenylate/guanylate cyclase domain-containing protein [Mesorhizobium shangrilense]
MATTGTLELRRRSRLKNLLVRAEREGAKLQFWARTASLVAIASFIALVSKWSPALLFGLGVLFLLFLSGYIQYLLLRRRRDAPWLGYVIGTFDIVLVTVLLIAPNPFGGDALPPAMQLRLSGFKFLLVFVCLGALSLSPRLAAWLGIAAAMSWLGAVIWVAAQPTTIIPATRLYGLALNERLRFHLNANFVDTVDQAANIFVILIIAAIIALVVSRSRRLADDYIKAERARVNLARHFSPNVVDELASEDEPFGPVRRQDMAVLFADIVDFTSYSEDHPAEEVFELLRQFHRRMEQVVFDNGGTVDNYIGDCIMATFGVPRAGSDDATRAIRCAEGIVLALHKWNASRAEAGLPPLDVRIGAQFGPAVLGAVGSERSLSFAVVGDTVNVASRLQALGRELGVNVCLGDALIQAARRENDGNIRIDAEDRGLVSIRGRDEPVHVWVLRDPEEEPSLSLSA